MYKESGSIMELLRGSNMNLIGELRSAILGKGEDFRNGFIIIKGRYYYIARGDAFTVDAVTNNPAWVEDTIRVIDSELMKLPVVININHYTRGSTINIIILIIHAKNYGTHS